METKTKIRVGAGLLALFSCLSQHATAQNSPAPVSLGDRDKPGVEIYPRYPVSKTSDPGPSQFSNDPTRAGVIALVYRNSIMANRPEEEMGRGIRPTTTVNGFNIAVKGVRYGFSPIDGFTGVVLGPAVQSVFLGNFGPGRYTVALSGEPGDTEDTSPSASTTVTTMVREFVVLSLDQAGKALLESPPQGSAQSGIGLISGWACVADRVEISIDGGPRIKVPGETGREDVLPVCGHGNAGFGTLLNYNRLGAGPHSIQLYVKGVPMGEPTRFNVIVPEGEFIRGIERELTIDNFPSAGKTATIDWREAEQNFRLKDVR